MRRRARNQLVLDLPRGGRMRLSGPVPEALVQALADLLLEALGNQNNAIATDRKACDAAEDHA
jgi:hypothetical protein